jgi:hypothetical protein
MKIETGPVSETLSFVVVRNIGRWMKSRNTVTVSVLQRTSESISKPSVHSVNVCPSLRTESWTMFNNVTRGSGLGVCKEGHEDCPNAGL